MQYDVRKLVDKKTRLEQLPVNSGSLIIEYIYDKSTAIGLSKQAAYSKTSYLCNLLQDIPDLKSATTADFIGVVNNVRDHYKQNSSRLALTTLRDFIRWLVNEGKNPDINLQKINSVKIPRTNTCTKTAQQMLTEDEVLAIINACLNDRDRALIMTLYDAGLRPIDACSLTWGDVMFDDHAAIINTSRKTQIPRYIPAVLARPYLAQWKAVHPMRNDKGVVTDDTPVFVTLKTPPTPLVPKTLAAALKEIMKRANLTKHVSPYLFDIVQ